VSIEDSIRTAVREEIRGVEERLCRLLSGATGDDLLSIPKAARACGLHPSTVRAQFLGRLTKYRAGRTLRISVSELRQLMRVAASGEESADAIADRIERKVRRG
jgi:hypothetical protein